MRYTHIVFGVEGTLFNFGEEQRSSRQSPLFSGIQNLLENLKDKGIALGAVTSKNRTKYEKDISDAGLTGYFGTVVCLEDVKNPKPDPEPIKRYLEITGARPEKTLYIGNSADDMECAKDAGVFYALALWGCDSVRHIRADHYFPEPYDVAAMADRLEDSKEPPPWLDWAVELQFIAQAGLTYSKDCFDVERFARVRELSAEIMSKYTGLSTEKVTGLFCNETGFQTPKLDTRAAIVKDGKILLVKERDGLWALPGGWMDVDQTVGRNTQKEVKEEAGLDVVPVKLVALQDMSLHNVLMFPYRVCKVFMLCKVIGGEFEKNTETSESRYFGPKELPPLSKDKTTEAQILMCLAAEQNKNWRPVFD